MKAVCPKCGWTTRELEYEEIEYVNQGRYRCSGECHAHAEPNNPQSFPPRLKMQEEEAKK